MLKIITALFAILVSSGIAVAQPAPSPDVLKDLAPTGKLRAAMNFGSPVLVQKGANGEPAGVTPDLNVRIDASAPTKVAESVFKGGLPPMSIDGDGALAADVNWIAQNVRWDPAADAERFFGPTVAEGVSRANAQFAQAAEVAKKAMGQMFDMLQSRKKN